MFWVRDVCLFLIILPLSRPLCPKAPNLILCPLSFCCRCNWLIYGQPIIPWKKDVPNKTKVIHIILFYNIFHSLYCLCNWSDSRSTHCSVTLLSGTIGISLLCMRHEGIWPQSEFSVHVNWGHIRYMLVIVLVLHTIESRWHYYLYCVLRCMLVIKLCEDIYIYIYIFLSP